MSSNINGFKVVSGHDRCHPETCTCWDYRVYDVNGVNVLNTDSYDELIKFCNEGGE